MAEAVLRLGHADRQLVKAHGREALHVGRTTAPAGVVEAASTIVTHSHSLCSFS
jgi:hypothetical protein